MLRKLVAIRSFDVTKERFAPKGSQCRKCPQVMTSSRTWRDTVETNNRVDAVWTNPIDSIERSLGA